ncbi:MAG: hypothetical protein HKL96_02620 [Phycisphaerales bacterium]|nr:hypothetical protein [Phycisphaerales bacterium]
MRTCCHRNPSLSQPGVNKRSPSAKYHLLRDMTAWAVPAGILLLVPKCPLCLAAYVMLCTGVALSAPAATRVRLLLIVLGGGTLMLMVVLRLYRWYQGSHPIKQECQDAEQNCHAR